MKGSVAFLEFGWTAAILLSTAISAPAEAQSQEPDASPRAFVSADAKVRGTTLRIVELITDGTERSKTFRKLMDDIQETDGIVYVAEGSCGHEVHACLLFSLTTTPANRVLRVLVDPRRSDVDLIGAVAHELQHAFEVLSVRSVQTNAAMALLYRRIGRLAGRRYETDAAIKLGDVVRAEFRKTMAARTHSAAANDRHQPRVAVPLSLPDDNVCP